MEEDPKMEVVLDPRDGGGYIAHVPSLPGCKSEGNSMEEALSNLQEAIKRYLAELMQEVMSNAKKEGLA